jgi:hypothetical protein
MLASGRPGGEDTRERNLMTDRPTSNARDHGEGLIDAGTDRLTSAAQGRKKSLLYVGAALALAGTGFAAAATAADSASAPVRMAGAQAEVVQLTALISTGKPAPPARTGTPLATPDPLAHPAAAARAVAAAPLTVAPFAAAVGSVAHPAAAARAVTPLAVTRDPLAHPAAAVRAAVPLAATTDPLAQHSVAVTQHSVTVKDNGPSAVTPHTTAPHVLPRHTPGRPDLPPAIAGPTGTQHAPTDKPAVTWRQLSSALNQEANPAAAAHHQVPLADRLTPVGVSGPQSWMPLSPAQVANASVIVKQALAKNMGIRSAVIAVATAMQESQLINVNYGTYNSLGLFQQQYNMGWGTPAQIMNPRYAADAFLTALQQYQASNPSWATQPLWQAAQGVQKSAFPYAYAKWEAQAASLVKQIVTHLPPAAI